MPRAALLLSWGMVRVSRDRQLLLAWLVLLGGSWAGSRAIEEQLFGLRGGSGTSGTAPLAREAVGSRFMWCLQK